MTRLARAPACGSHNAVGAQRTLDDGDTVVGKLCIIPEGIGVEMTRIRLASDEECAVRNSRMAERGVSKADAYTQFIPNMGRLLSIRPDIGVPFGELFGVLMVEPGGLTRTQREMIAIVASRANRCHY